jgi:hypothetical protein
MLVMFTAKYPASSVKRAIEVFSSPETPKRSDAGKEVSKPRERSTWKLASRG